MNLRRTLLAGAAALLVCLFVTPISADANTSSGVTSNTVLFGASYPQTGISSPGISSYYFGIAAYFDHVNANGGIYGRKLVFLTEDNSGTPTGAVTKTVNLLSSLGVFGLISNAPSCPNQLAAAKSAGLARLGVPNTFVDCFLENTEESQDQNSTNFYSKISAKDEASILKAYIDKTYPNQRIAVVSQDGDNSLYLSKLTVDSKVICNKVFNASIQTLVIGCNSSTSPLRDGDVVLYAGSPTGLVSLIANYSISQKLNLKYFVNYDAYNPRVFQITPSSAMASAEIHTLSHNALITETANKAVSTLVSIGQKYAPGIDIDQRFLNGLNAGYVIAGVLAAVGPELDRDRFMQAMTLFGPKFDLLGVSEKSQKLTERFISTGGVIVKNFGSSSEAISEVLTLEQGKLKIQPRKVNQFSPNGLPSVSQLLPTPTPTPTPAATSKPTPAPSATADPIVENEGEEEEPFGKVTIKKDKNKYTISISSNLPNEILQVRATKKGAKSIVYKITTNDDGAAKFTTTRVLAGFQVALLLDGEILTSVKAG